MSGTRVSGLSYSTAWRSSHINEFPNVTRSAYSRLWVTIWIESVILGPRTVERALASKDYDKGSRVHKITLQAM